MDTMMKKREAFRRELQEHLKVDASHAEAIVASAEASGILAPPGTKVTNVIWLLVVGSFSAVLLAAAATLVVGTFNAAPQEQPVTSSETILMVFTTVVGFLAGMLSPSPVNTAN
jgi:type III secretory pathway component EscS